MIDTTMTDAAFLASLLTELRLPSIARNWKRVIETADRDGWPAQKVLATLMEIEVAERASRRIQRHRDQSETPAGKTFASFDFAVAPEVRKPQVLALGAGADWIKNGDNLLIFGKSGTGKSHVLAAICHALIDAGKHVLFTQTIDMVQRLQIARPDLSLVSALRSSTNSISSCSTTSHTSARIKPRQASCSNSSRIDTSDTASPSPPTKRFPPG